MKPARIKYQFADPAKLIHSVVTTLAFAAFVVAAGWELVSTGLRV